MKRNFLKSILFLVLTALVLLQLRSALLPIWADWNNYGAARGFYQEPDNTVEVLILGSSVSANGISAMELYEQYGICAYNYGTARQPLLVSYYWLLEAYKHHSESLKVLVLEPSMLVDNDLVTDAHYNRGLAYMDFSRNKVEAYRSFAGSPLETISKMSVFFNYHSRWNELTRDNLAETRPVVKTPLRGSNVSFQWLSDTAAYDKISHLTGDYDPEAGESEFSKDALEYYYKIADFCREHDISLILSKVINTRGTGKWSSADHAAAVKLAEETGADIIDLCFSPYFEETGFNPYFDAMDTQHMNPWGTSKITSVLGRYLTEHYDLKDVREDPDYAFMKDEDDDYQALVTTVKDLCMKADPADYLATALAEDDYTTILSVRGGAVSALTDEQRNAFSSLGLEKLSRLKDGSTYLAVVEDGVIREISSKNKGSSFTGRLRNGAQLKVVSADDHASVTIDGTAWSPNEEGLNVVIYDGDYREVLLADSFPTGREATRESRDYAAVLAEAETKGLSFDDYPASLQKYCLYLRRCAMAQLGKDLEDASVSQVLEAYMKEPDTRILIAVSKGNVKALDDDQRTALRELGLTNLADCRKHDAYVGVIDNGSIVFDSRKDTGEAVSAETLDYRITSDPGAEDTVIVQEIGGKDFSMKRSGIYIYVYDGLQQKTVFDSRFVALRS